MERNDVIEKILSQGDYPDYTDSQIFHNIYHLGKKSFNEISNISKELKSRLSDEWGEVNSLKLIDKQTSEQAEKYLFETKDGLQIEAVLMIYKPNKEREYEHKALCMSTQIGCAMGCQFCATGAIGFKRDLTATEIVDQLLYFIQNDINVNTLFFSGMGEPFANSNFFNALEILCEKEYFGLSQRRISISTVGVIPGINKLTKEFPQVNLAFSLHSPFEEQRKEIMPVQKAYPLEEVMEALKNHVETTNRKVFLAYIMLKGVNDTMEHAKQLVKIIRNVGKKSYLFHVNLIKYHNADSFGNFKASSDQRIEDFKNILEKSHIHTTIRQDFGLEIDAACGQLAAEYKKKNN